MSPINPNKANINHKKICKFYIGQTYINENVQN